LGGTKLSNTYINFKNKLKDIINYIADKQGFRLAVIEKDYYLTKIPKTWIANP